MGRRGGRGSGQKGPRGYRNVDLDPDHRAVEVVSHRPDGVLELGDREPRSGGDRPLRGLDVLAVHPAVQLSGGWWFFGAVVSGGVLVPLFKKKSEHHGTIIT